MSRHLCEGCGREHSPCCPDCQCTDAEDTMPQSLLEPASHEDILPGVMDAALYEHRGTIMADRRYHCVCSWVSEQANLHALQRADVRRHLIAAMFVAIRERVL